jgi:ribonucleoside-triphosphate reductase
MIEKVVKRSGAIEQYCKSKIAAAIGKAFAATRPDPSSDADQIGVRRRVETITNAVESALSSKNTPATIEEIQDTVETALIEAREVAAAKAYILYRARHEVLRDTKKLLLDIDETMKGYLNQSDWRVNENANVNYSLGGLILHNSGSVTANYWLKNVYPPEIADAHRSAAFHLHDLSMFSGYCAGWSLRALIKEGLGGVPDKITSKPARHLSTLMQQAVNFLGCLQNEWAGAQAFSSFDTYIAPFVRADNLTDREVKQCLQSFVFGVNTPSRWGSQAPFTNITLDWTVPEDLADKKAVVGGKEVDFTYGDCQNEMNRVNRLFIELMLEGDANGRGFQYPIPTYNITKEFDWNSPNAKLLFEMTSRYGTPYFQNFINSDLNPSDVRSMCPLLGTTRVLARSGGSVSERTIREIVEQSANTLLEVWTPSGWSQARPVKTPITNVYRITISNGDVVCMGENHLQPTKNNGTLPASSLRVGMRLPYGNRNGNLPVENAAFDYYSITKVENIGKPADESLYCFEVTDESHLFMLASGLFTHNCRLRLDVRELRKRGGGLFGSAELTGSVGVVTINLPQIGYLTNTDTEFFARLERLMELARDSLVIKRKTVTRLLEGGLFPYTKRYLGTLDNHFDTIGLVGMNECLLNYLGCGIATPTGQAFALRVLGFMRGKLADFQEETGELFNLEATPAESTSYRLAKHDKERYPLIITAGTDDAPYYTNSTQLPVMQTEDIFDALDLQEKLQIAYTGGTVFHAYLGEAIEDWRVCRDLVRAIAGGYHIPYFTISPTFSVCPVHGYLAGEHFTCPKCKAEEEERLRAKIAALEIERTEALKMSA